MKSKLIDEQGQKTFALIFDKGDEFIDSLTSFARENELGGSHFTAIGAFRDVMLGYFDRETKKIQRDTDGGAGGSAFVGRGYRTQRQHASGPRACRAR